MTFWPECGADKRTFPIGHWKWLSTYWEKHTLQSTERVSEDCQPMKLPVFISKLQHYKYTHIVHVVYLLTG